MSLETVSAIPIEINIRVRGNVYMAYDESLLNNKSIQEVSKFTHLCTGTNQVPRVILKQSRIHIMIWDAWTVYCRHLQHAHLCRDIQTLTKSAIPKKSPLYLTVISFPEVAFDSFVKASPQSVTRENLSFRPERQYLREML